MKTRHFLEHKIYQHGINDRIFMNLLSKICKHSWEVSGYEIFKDGVKFWILAAPTDIKRILDKYP